MVPIYQIDNIHIYIRYLSSLRTYLKFQDLNELSQEDVCIKSISFCERDVCHSKFKSNPVEKSFSKFNSFTVENMLPSPKNKFDPIDKNSIKNEDGHKMNTNIVDLQDLSFSNENETETFLNEIMTTDMSKFNFICTADDKSDQSIDQDIFRHRHKPLTEQTNTFHKARMVLVDNEEDHFYENDDIIRSCREQKRIYVNELENKRFSSHEPNIMTPNKKSKLNQVRKSSLFQSPFRKYLIESPKRLSGAVKFPLIDKLNFTPNHQKQIHKMGFKSKNLNRPDLISPKMSPLHMQTLSKFHKVG